MAKRAADLTIPADVQENARKGLHLREEHGYGGTEVGEEMAERLARGGEVTEEEVRHIAQYFPRHAHDNLDETEETGKPSRGYIAWLLWGGDAGRAWSERAVEALDREG
ncbi:DNA-binding protein [Deinococcus planocerae]|uniref:DNA-binding protein n=1 Tax=Deinococcus planocerae TaxID=1737569 RepID=UPI000C7F69D8|nr:DNA-binding protein [Deinococcus planocerae]